MTPAEQPVFALEVAGVPVLTFQAVSHCEATSLPRGTVAIKRFGSDPFQRCTVMGWQSKTHGAPSQPEELRGFPAAKAATVEPVG